MLDQPSLDWPWPCLEGVKQPLQLRISFAGMGWCQEMVDQGFSTVRPSSWLLIAAALWV